MRCFFTKKVFIVEDDPIIRRELSVFLSKNGYLCAALLRSTFIYHDKEYELTKNELRILTLLYERRGTIVGRDELMIQLQKGSTPVK